MRWSGADARHRWGVRSKKRYRLPHQSSRSPRPTGCRPGEVAALRWADLNVDDATLSVSRSCWYESSEKWSFGPTKTRLTRVLSLPAVTLAALKTHRAKQNTDKLAMGECYRRDLDLIFATPLGTPISMDAAVHRFKALLASAGLPNLRLYDLRHSVASLLLAELPIKVVQDQLGHATAKYTLDTYGHVMPGAMKEAATAMDRLLGT